MGADMAGLVYHSSGNLALVVCRCEEWQGARSRATGAAELDHYAPSESNGPLVMSSNSSLAQQRFR